MSEKKRSMSDFIKEVLRIGGKMHQDQIVHEFLKAKEKETIPLHWTVDSILRLVRKMAEGPNPEIRRYGSGMYSIKLEPTKDQTDLRVFITERNEP